jgi:hypothetical protein
VKILDFHRIEELESFLVSSNELELSIFIRIFASLSKILVRRRTIERWSYFFILRS